MSAALDSIEPIYVETPTVGCDGGGGPQVSSMGHPKVYLKIGAEGEITCPYCSRRFILAEGSEEAPGH